MCESRDVVAKVGPLAPSCRVSLPALPCRRFRSMCKKSIRVGRGKSLTGPNVFSSLEPAFECRAPDENKDMCRCGSADVVRKQADEGYTIMDASAVAKRDEERGKLPTSQYIAPTPA